MICRADEYQMRAIFKSLTLTIDVDTPTRIMQTRSHLNCIKKLDSALIMDVNRVGYIEGHNLIRIFLGTMYFDKKDNWAALNRQRNFLLNICIIIICVFPILHFIKQSHNFFHNLLSICSLQFYYIQSAQIKSLQLKRL